DDVARTGSYGNAGTAGRTGNRRPAVAVDGNRAGDVDRPIFAGIERRDDSIGTDGGVGVRKRGARLGDGARIPVDARRRDKRAGERPVLGVRRYGWQRE